jgi:hypothetical protein
MHATNHLVAQTTVAFDADALWPLLAGSPALIRIRRPSLLR